MITGYYAPQGCTLSNCHLEYCFAGVEIDGYAKCTQWYESVPAAAVNLGANVDGTVTYYSMYRTVVGGTVSQSSYCGTASITIIEGAPVVDVSPAGVLGSNYTGVTHFQSQLINGFVGQYVTYDAASAGAGTVNVTFEPCILGSSCATAVTLPQTQLAGYTLPSVWAWIDPRSVSYSYNYIELFAVDEAGNPNNTGTPSSAQFTLFNGNTTTENITCSPSACTDLADGTGESGGFGDIPNDPPSQAVGGNTFSGYADPTMRANTLVSSDNPYGTNLWMGYSWPFIQTFPNNSTVGVVESHLAESVTSNGPNGGNWWTAWCSGGGICDAPTPIYPSVLHGDEATDPYHFSSHEVLNLWPYIVQPNSGSTVGTETWYAAHLMYYRYYGPTHTLRTISRTMAA